MNLCKLQEWFEFKKYTEDRRGEIHQLKVSGIGVEMLICVSSEIQSNASHLRLA